MTMAKTTKTDSHPCHRCDLPRINRVGGQIEGVKAMIEEGRYCPDILTQIRAIRSALKSLESNILERHLSHCVSDAIKSGTEKDRQKKLEEIKEIFRRYDET